MYNFANLYKKMLGTALCCTVLLTGCTAPYTETPVATNFKREKNEDLVAQDQHKLQSASHWQVIADDAASNLKNTLGSHKQPLYVVQSQKDSRFQQAFTQQLISSLISSGYSIMPPAVSAIDEDEQSKPSSNYTTVKVKVDPVHFNSKRPRDPIAGEVTMLTGGLWVLRNTYRNVSPGAAMMGSAVTFDAYNYFNSKYNTSKPKTELVVTTSIYDSQRYYANETNVYYTTESDWGHYSTAKETTELPMTKFKVERN